MTAGLPVIGVVCMLGGLAGLVITPALFSTSAVGIIVQVLAVGLMLWARAAFGSRSFHAAAAPVAGGLVTAGPYGFIRHPIYTAICLFAWAGALPSGVPAALGFAALVTAGAIMRMIAEEHLLVQVYPEYTVYAEKTKRMVPGMF
jgi:protein-S-isoprenylcysteine O-methyltransferase Ste14